MSTSASYGTGPRQQTNWDARAAVNFICGGAGTGLIVAAALSGARGLALAVPVLLALALIATGLVSVLAEIGRPLRAVNVLFNPRTSWMTREAMVAPLVFATGLAAAFGYEPFIYVAAACALLFVYCQGRMLRAAKGIPAWRVPSLPRLIVATGLVEGAGLWLLTAVATGAAAALPAVWLALVVVVRVALYRAYRNSLGTALARQAAVALDQAERVLLVLGTVVPLALLAIVAASGAMWVAALGGMAAAAAGVHFKLRLVLAAGCTQGFALAHLPVRGVRS